MIDRWLSWLNGALIGLALLFGLAGIGYWLSRPGEITQGGHRSQEGGLPKGAFELAEKDYEKAGEVLLSLEQAPPIMQLPDLRTQLIYYGKNGRPDAQSQQTVIHFALSGNNKNATSVAPGENLYLVYERKGTSGKYVFSPNNEKSSLWVQGVPVDNEVQVKVRMENENGEEVAEPETYAQFRLPEKEFVRYGGVTWELGGHRVDGTLFARQKARWCGPDRFLERHGGEDYKNIDGKQRIDFTESDEPYSVFVKAGDCLIWSDNRWKMIEPGDESLKKPLLVVKKTDERLMTFELWDVDGKGKIVLNLLKSSEPWAVQNGQTLQHMFKFLGAKTKTQCVFEINRERVVLSPSDWLILTPKGWKKLATEEEIDNYVKRKLSGTLFVFDGIVRKDEKQMMVGTLYSPSRHECNPIELPLQVKTLKGSNKDGKDKLKEMVETAKGTVPSTQTSDVAQRTGQPTPPNQKK